MRFAVPNLGLGRAGNPCPSPPPPPFRMLYSSRRAEVAELADAPALGAGGRKAVGVRVPSSAGLPMNRRAFAKSIIQSTASAIAASGFPSAALSAPQSTAAATIPFRFSVMLWTVFRDLPFDQRLEKVAEAGIKNVELTGEFSKWSDDDFVKF